MKRVLVTGANGQLGLTLKDLASNHDDLSFDFKPSSELDITSVESIAEVFKRKSYDYCINCAAYTAVDKAEVEPEKAFAVNAQGVKNLAEACKTYDVVLIHISTDYVFDGTKHSPYNVHDKTNPINIYGKSKLKGEQYIQDILKHHYIVRTSWLYSKEYGRNFYRTIKAKAEKGEIMKIVDDQIGCPTNTVNLSNYLINLIHENCNYGVKHYCDGEVMSWYAFANQIILESGIKSILIPIPSKALMQMAKRPPYSVL